MSKKKFALLVFLLSLCIFAVQADVPPDPGNMRMRVDLILEVQDDFPGYRFFLQTPIDVEEVSLKKGETKNFEADNRGGPKRFATLLAVPSETLTKMGFNKLDKAESENDLKRLHESLRGKKIEGVIEVVKHSFQKDIPTSQKANWKNPVYKLEKDESKSIKATPIVTNAVSLGVYSEEKDFDYSASALIIGGSLISAAVLFLGIWFFRRKSRRIV